MQLVCSACDKSFSTPLLRRQHQSQCRSSLPQLIHDALARRAASVRQLQLASTFAKSVATVYDATEPRYAAALQSLAAALRDAAPATLLQADADLLIPALLEDYSFYFIQSLSSPLELAAVLCAVHTHSSHTSQQLRWWLEHKCNLSLVAQVRTGQSEWDSMLQEVGAASSNAVAVANHRMGDRDDRILHFHPDKVVSVIHKHVLGGTAGTVVDLGCGYGYFSAAFAEVGHQVCAVDTRREAVEDTVQFCVDRNSRESGTVHPVLALGSDGATLVTQVNKVLGGVSQVELLFLFDATQYVHLNGQLYGGLCAYLKQIEQLLVVRKIDSDGQIMARIVAVEHPDVVHEFADVYKLAGFEPVLSMPLIQGLDFLLDSNRLVMAFG